MFPISLPFLSRLKEIELNFSSCSLRQLLILAFQNVHCEKAAAKLLEINQEHVLLCGRERSRSKYSRALFFRNTIPVSRGIISMAVGDQTITIGVDARVAASSSFRWLVKTRRAMTQNF